MVSDRETTSIRRFVCGQLRDEPDLSTLTLRILKRRYLAHVKCESLSPEARNFMKRVVEEELMKMQDSDETGGELEIKKLQNKRKREKENDEVISGKEDEDESRAKKSRLKSQSSSSSESEDKEGCKTGSEESEVEKQIKSEPESEDEKQGVKKSPRKTSGNGKQPLSSEDSADEEIKGNESNCGDSPKEMEKKTAGTTKNGETGSSNKSQGKKKPQSEENETDSDSKSEKSDKINSNDSSDDSEKEQRISVETKNNDPDSDSSSLPSIEDEQDSERGQTRQDKQDNEKKKSKKKEEHARDKKDDNKAVVRLKRYITLCGARRNYKKLLSGCRSVRSQVAVLKKELEDLGVDGVPTIEKCKKARLKREEAQELAELDVSNIIATQGRPKRRGASERQEKQEPPSSTYLRSLNSGSDSDQENKTHRSTRRATDWANLQGIISDDADSD